ncbi:hypothetical protein [Daejeonella oryzae]|uniref:hypothetical protein n=1 Tax=Daejeonella oryzae TaxID=1122943 RepID=UPI00040A0162|nr:hypothetical protein [Daejeonella oryzae]
MFNRLGFENILSIFDSMAISNTQSTLDKLELLLNALNYKVRYEKGNFKTGACVLEKSRIIVVNKFSNLESKILSLSKLLRELPAVDDSELSENQKTFLYQLKQTKLEF